MKYEIRLSAPNGDIVPLGVVASEKAVARATAGHTPFHEPTYKGSFQGFAAALLQEAKSGRLRVCDLWGSQSTAAELISRAEVDGTLVQSSRFIKEPDWDRLNRENEPVVPGAKVWNLAHLDLGPTVPDLILTDISALFTTLKWLNDWGTAVGDEFALNHDGVEWFDERGILVGQAAPHGERDALLTDEKPAERDDRRYRELKAVGGNYIEDNGKWRVTGVRGLLATLSKREKANGRPMSDEKDVRNSLKKAAMRAKRAHSAGPKGNSVFNR